MTGWEAWRELLFASPEITPYRSDGWNTTELRGTAPAVYLPLDVRQTEKEFVLEASVPGFNPEEIEVVSDQGTLTIRGERKVEALPEGRYLRRERRQLSFFRQLKLPTEVRAGEISARFVNGVLTIRIPRVEAPAPTRVKIEVDSTIATADLPSEPVAPMTSTSPV